MNEKDITRSNEMHRFDTEKRHGKYLAGVDEVGRGPCAGPVTVAAIILPENCIIEGIDDSKKLTEHKREQLFDIIKEKALAYSIVSVDEKTIDEINILQATFKAMREAVANLEITPNYVLIDGNKSPGIDIPHETIIKGDGKSMSVAAASILAKVTRDRFMVEMSEKYPQYGFEKHKGYPTPAHKEAIKKYGLCEIHRKSYKLKF